MDFEGRNLRVDFDDLSVMSLYLPSGTNAERLDINSCTWTIFKITLMI
jgi:exonuclease III